MWVKPETRAERNNNKLRQKAKSNQTQLIIQTYRSVNDKWNMKLVFILFVVLAILALGQISAQEYEIDAEAEDFGQFGGGSNDRELTKEVASEQDAPIIRAASHGDFQLVSEFIRDGQPLNTQNEQGWTAVTYAAANGYSDIVREVRRTC